jgi:hypothetical protein
MIGFSSKTVDTFLKANRSPSHRGWGKNRVHRRQIQFGRQPWFNFEWN